MRVTLFCFVCMAVNLSAISGQSVNSIEWVNEDLVDLLEEIPAENEADSVRRKRGETGLAYSLTLDPDSNFKFHWTPFYTEKYVQFQIDLNNFPPQSWFAVGFSSDGRWQQANLCAVSPSRLILVQNFK